MLCIVFADGYKWCGTSHHGKHLSGKREIDPVFRSSFIFMFESSFRDYKPYLNSIGIDHMKWNFDYGV